MCPLYFWCSFLSLILVSTGCRMKDHPNQVYRAADSILTLTMALQSEIGSPEVQRMHDFQVEISEDIKILSAIPSEDEALLQYRELSEGLGQCIQACNQFHEEAFMLETSLRDIMEQSLDEETKHSGLRKELLREMEIYNELYQRVDSSLSYAIMQAEIFYSLKPEIDSIMEESEIPSIH